MKVRQVVGSVIALIASILGILAWVTGATSLPELLGQKPQATISAAPSAAAPAATPPASPCEALARMGFRCAAESLLESLAGENLPVARLFVAAGIDANATVHSDWDGSRTVLDRARSRGLPGLGPLLVAMAEQESLDSCDAIDKALTLEMGRESRCALLKDQSCEGKRRSEYSTAAAEERQRIGADYDALTSLEKCVESTDRIRAHGIPAPGRSIGPATTGTNRAGLRVVWRIAC